MRQILDNIVEQISNEIGIKCSLLNHHTKTTTQMMIIVNIDNWTTDTIGNMQIVLDKLFSTCRAEVIYYEDGNFGSPSKVLLSMDIRDYIRDMKLNKLV